MGGELKLKVAITGPFGARWDGESLELRSLKGRALVAWLAIRGRPATREQAAELLWGPNGRRNLRQALYELRQLPGAEHWLSEDHGHLAVDAELETPEGGFLADLGSGRLPVAWLEWRDSAARQVVSRRDDPLVAPLAALLAALAETGDDVDFEVLARALDVPESVLFRVLDRARDQVGGATVDAATHARLAMAYGSAEAAAVHWEQAGRRDRADAVRASIWIRALEVGSGDGSVDTSIVDALRALRRTRPTPQIEAALDLHRAREMLREGMPDVAEDLAREAAYAARSAGLAVEEARAHVLIGTLHLRGGRPDEALEAFESALTGGDVATRLRARAGQGAVLATLGRLDEALEAHRAGLDLARTEGTAREVARALCNVASDQSRLGRYATALLRYREAVEAAEAVCDTPLGVLARVNGSVAALWSGALGPCRRLVQEALTAAGAAGMGREHALALGTRAELEAACGRCEEAVHWAERALEHHIRSDEPVRRDLIRADIAIYRLEDGQGSWPAVSEALSRLDGVGRPLLAWRARLDAGLWCPLDALTELVETLEATRPTGLVDRTLLGQHALVVARLARGLDAAASIDGEAVVGLASRPGHLQPLAAVAAVCWGVGGPEVASVVAARAEGLLPAQRRRLAARVDRFRALLDGVSSDHSSTSQ